MKIVNLRQEDLRLKVDNFHFRSKTSGRVGGFPQKSESEK